MEMDQEEFDEMLNQLRSSFFYKLKNELESIRLRYLDKVNRVLDDSSILTPQEKEEIRNDCRIEFEETCLFKRDYLRGRLMYHEHKLKQIFDENKLN